MDSTEPDMAAAGNGYLNSKAVIVGLAFMTVGGVMGAWGMGMSGRAMLRSLRRWLRAQQLEGAIAEPKTVPARAASPAGGTALRKEMQAASPAR